MHNTYRMLIVILDEESVVRKGETGVNSFIVSTKRLLAKKIGEPISVAQIQTQSEPVSEKN